MAILVVSFSFGQDKIKQNIDTKEICTMHNKIIKKMDSKLITAEGYIFDDNGISYSKDVISHAKEILDQIDGNRYNTDFDESIFIEIIQRHNSDNNVINFSELVSYSSNYLKEKGFISKYLNSELVSLGNKSIEYTTEEILYYVENEFAVDISENELSKRNLIVEMVFSSNDFWEGETQAMADGDTVIIADAVGALVGSLLSPAGSIIYGAMYSLLENNIKDHR